MPKVQLPSGQIVSVPDELEGQAALDYLDEQERKLTPPGGMTRAAAGVYQGLAGYGEKAANVLERMGLPGQAATAQEFSSAMLDAPDVWQSKQHAPGIGGALAEMGGQLFADLPMIMGAMGAARVPLGAAETLTGRTILPRAGQTFMQQWPRVIGEAAVGGGMLEGATARPNVESAYAKGVEGAGEWALGAAILHPAFKTLGWAASKILGRLRGKPNMTPEMAASDPNLPMVLDRLQKGEKEADIIIDLTQRQGVWEAPPGGPSPPPPQVAGTQRRLPAPTADEYARAVTGELYREGPGGQGEMILETRLGRRKPAEEVPDVSLPYDAASAGVQGELPLSTRIRRRKGQAELPLQMRTTLPETRAGEEPSVIYSQKERRFTDKAQGVLPMEMGTGRIPGTIERGTLPETPPTESPLAPRPMTVEEMDKVPTQQLGLDFTGVTKMQVPKVLPSEMPFKVGQKVRYQGKTRKITGVKGKEFILDDMIAVPAADLKSVGGRRAKPTALESPILPEGEVTKPQGPFEKAPPPSGGEPINLRKVKVEVVEAPKKLVDDLRSVGYSDEFIATLVADHGIEGATTLYKARIAAISQKMKERDAQIRKALGQQVREGVPEEKLRSGEGAELDKSIKDDLINLADAIDDVETKAVAEGRPLTPQEEEEIVSAAVRTGIVPVQKAATNVTPKTRTAADLLRERLTLLKERGLAESEPVTITKTGQIRSKPRPKQSDEELLRLIEESEQDMRGELDHTDGIRKKYDEGDWDSLLKAVPFLLALPASAIASMLAPPEAHAMYGGLMAKAVPKGTRWFSSLVDMLPRFEFSDPVSWKPGAWEGMKQSGFFSADTQFDYKLSDLVNWPEGFLHYPDLDKIKVKKRGGFLDIFQTQKGAFFEESETLVISPFLDEAQALATLKHELQHYIQFVEGFTRGGSPKFIDWREAYEPLLKYYEDTEQLGKLQMLRERGPAVLEEVEKLFEMRYALSKQAEAFDASLGLAQKEAEKFKALNRELVKIREEFDSVYLNYNKLVELYGKGFTTNPEYKMIEAARKRVNKAADEAFTTYLEAVRRANSYRDRIRLLNIPGANSFIEKQKPLDDFAYDAYKLLGGEAEARDTVLRTLLTKAERESIMPMHMALAKGEELPRAEHLVKTMGLPGKPAGPYEKPVPQRDYLKALSAIVLGTGALALASDAEARTVFHGTHTGAIRRFLDKFIGSGEGSSFFGEGAANRAAAFGSIDLDLSSRGKLEQIRKVKEVYKDLKFGDIKEKGPEKWLYTVELPDDLKLLDLDERLDHSQLEVIRDGLRNLYREKIDPMATPPKWAQRTDASKIAQVAGELSATIDAKAKPNMGHEYQLALQTLFGDRGASMFLRDYAGFKGNTYIGRTSGERNYVIFDEDIPQIREKEKGNAAVGLLATVLGLAGTAALGSYAYYKLRDFMEAQGRKADELKGMLQKGELNMPEVATAGLSGAGLSALKESIMRALEKTSMFQRSTNQTLEGGQRVTWAEQKAKINPLSEWFVDPSRMAERLGKDVSNWWADLMKADNITSYNFKNHATLFRDVEKTLTKEEQLRMRDILEGTKKPQTQAEEAAYGKLRSFYDEMWNKVVESRQKVYEQNLSEEEYGAFVKVFKEGASEEQVLKGMPREQAEVMKEIFKDYRDLQTKGKIEEYVTKHELGQYHLIEEIVGEDGKVSRRIVANAVSRKDALRKAKKYFEENPDKRSLVIDSNGMLNDLATALPRGSYYRVIRDLGKALKEDITWIEKELGKAVGNKSDIARRAVRRAFTLRPSEKFSPYLQERKDILKGEENIFDVLPAYAMSIEKKTNLDPLINEARRLLQGIDDPMGRQWLSNLIEDTKGRYWMSDRIVDTLLRNLNVEASPLAFSRGIAKIKQGEAMMKFAYRPVAAFINRLSGEGHTWVKFGTESFLDAKRFIKTPEGREFLKLVDPYMGVSYATDASGRIKPKESLWHPLGMFQAAEMPNRETTLAAAYLHALKNLGLNKAEAQEYAIRQNWFTQFTYNAASLPRILRTPVGRLLGQFKPYMLKEVEFIRQLGGQELVRYMAFQLAMGGPRGLLMLLKSLPLLGAWAALDDAEMWLNKHAARTSRGIGGALGVDVTAAATMQLPSRVEDWAGPFLSDLLRINKEVIQPMMRGEGGVARGAWKSLEGSIPIIRYWPELVIDRLMTKGQKDYIIKDDRGRELYRLQWPDYLKEAAGAEPLESSRIRVAEAILNRRQAATNKKKGQVIDTYVKALEGGQPVPPELIAEMQLLGVTPGSVRREARLRGLTPMQRRMLRTELGRRAMLQLEYPIEGE
jgi:antitoxin component of MazEF toxin-antitoxin module